MISCRFLDDDEGLEPELAADQRQADVLAVLVTVANDHAARARQRQHRHEFGLAARFQAEALAVVRSERTGDPGMLVNLDRIHRGVTAGVIPLGHRLRERALQLAQAVAEDIGEAHQQRQLRALRLRLVDHVGQRDLRPLRTTRRHGDAAGRVDIEVTLRPVRNRIGLAGVVERPGGHRRASFDGKQGRIGGKQARIVGLGLARRRCAGRPQAD